MIPHYKDLLKASSKDEINVTLKKDTKGIGLYATQDITIGDVIAYYQIKVFNNKKYNSPTDYTYGFAVYKKDGKEYKTLIGDIYEDTFSEPEDGITFWAPFSNEPSPNQKINAEIEIDEKGIFKSLERNYLLPGDILIYYLVSIKKIKKGDEIMWYYGSTYERNYKVNKKS